MEYVIVFINFKTKEGIIMRRRKVVKKGSRAWKFRALREKMFSDQMEMARALNITPGTISGYENGRTPRLEIAWKIIELARKKDIRIDRKPITLDYLVSE